MRRAFALGSLAPARSKRRAFALGTFGAALAILGAAAIASASGEQAQTDLVRAGAEALSAGKYDEAIADFEAYADSGAPHPDASFDRGLAYVMRVRNGAERAGDLGRAAAAFEEALAMRPGDDDARHALTLARAEVARRRARSGKNVVVHTPSFDRVVAGLATPRSWAYAAIAASWSFALGLALRRRREGPAHLGGALLACVAGVALALLLPIALWADHLDRTEKPAVLVAKEAFLTDRAGTALGGDPVTEAAQIAVGARSADRVRVRYGSREGWIPVEDARVLRVR